MPNVDPKVMDKIKKLLALGTSPNENEAQSALSMAAKLMEKHNIAAADMEVHEDGSVTMNVGENATHRMPKLTRMWSERLIGVLDKCFNCQSVIVTHFDQVITIGAPADLEMHIWYLKKLRLQIMKMAEHKYPLVKDQREYALGVTLTVAERLKEIFIETREAERSEETTALVVVKNDEVQKRVDEMFGKIKKSMVKGPELKNREAFLSGRADGKNVRLHKEIQ